MKNLEKLVFSHFLMKNSCKKQSWLNFHSKIFTWSSKIDIFLIKKVTSLSSPVIDTSRERPLNGLAVITVITARPLYNGNGRLEIPHIGLGRYNGRDLYIGICNNLLQ